VSKQQRFKNARLSRDLTWSVKAAKIVWDSFDDNIATAM
jgi:hypothetical protein